MSDIAISYDEEMVGAGHPTKSDTLNRLFLAGGMRLADGRSNWEAFQAQEAAPSTGADEGALYAMETGGVLRLFWRRPSDGASLEVGGMEVLDQGESAVSWSVNQAVVPLSGALDDLTACMLRLNSGGAGLAANGVYAWLEEDQIQLRTVDGAAGTSGTLAWQVVRAPAGQVQRGRTSVNAATGGGTTDIALSNSIDPARAVVSLLHLGRYVGRQTDYFSGYLKPHATDGTKLQAVMTSQSGAQAAEISWECWSP